MCRYALDFIAEGKRNGSEWARPDGFLVYSDWLWSNREPLQTTRIDQGVRGPTFHVPKETFTVTFDAHAAGRYLLSRFADLSAWTYSNARAVVEAFGDAAFVIDLRPAEGFEGLQLAYGEPPINLPPGTVDDRAIVEVGESVAIEVKANDTDPEGHVLTVTEVSALAQDAATAGADGKAVRRPCASGHRV